MDAQTTNFTPPESVTDGVKPLNTHRMTKEGAMQLSDAELLQMIDKATGHTGKDFQDFMNCDFSYTTLTNILKDRGYENGWHKTSEGSSPIIKATVIPMKKSEEETVRRSYSLEKSIADEWNDFNKNVPFKSVTLGCALKRFMTDCRSGKIKFELEI
ncbi:MAG: hypothetical protein K5879_03050 [Lachnospiraceae bacterium]|nr:hypothetical protein [Lachnospiraceae bacterium]